MLEILAMVKQSLECWKAHQRHARHLIMDTWLLEKISEKEEKTVYYLPLSIVQEQKRKALLNEPCNQDAFGVSTAVCPEFL